MTVPEKETRLSARQLVKSLKKYQLNELAMLLAALHEEDTTHCADSVVYEELLAAGRRQEADSFMAVYNGMVEAH